MRQVFLLGALVAALVTGAAADELFVPADGSTVMTDTLLSGQWYIIESRGTYGYRDPVPEKIADAEWAYNSVDEVWVETPAGGDLDLHVDRADILMMGTVDGVSFDPHVFSPEHVYRARILGADNPVELSIFDERYDDNTGGLQIRIWPAIVGDANVDDVVDASDLGHLMSQFGGAPGDQSADFNGDGAVDLADFALQRSSFGLAAASAESESPDDFGAIIPGS